MAGRDAIFVAGNFQNISAAPTGLSALHQLPAAPAVFTGRDDELAELLAQLTAGHAAGAAISGKTQGLQGMGGVGKTALAVVLAHRLAEGNALFNSAVAFESLGNRAEALARAGAALEIYEAIEDPNAAKVRAQLAEWRAGGK